MITYRPPIESRKNFLSTGNELPEKESVRGEFSVQGYRSVMTRQSIHALLRNLPQKNAILPRFVPAGVYHPVIETKKRIFYYDVPTDLSIDEQFALSLGLDPSDTIFYYIHQFGLHLPRNIQFMRTMQHRGYYVIDDRSLSLPALLYEEFADATAYSFYKLVGLPYGGEVRTKVTPHVSYGASSEHNLALMRKMKHNYLFYSNHVLPYIPAFPYRAFNHVFSKYVKFCSLSKAPWSDPLPLLPDALSQRLLTMDFEAVTKRRTEIAGRYYDTLDHRVLFPLPREAFIRQSAVGFPILVNDPLKLLKYLVRKGVVTTRFIDIWWWDRTQEENELYRRNILLPAHHGLSDTNVNYIVRTVNEGLIELGEV